jgi:hypothetical protein
MLKYIGEHIAKNKNLACELDGIDLSDEMIKIGNKIAPSANLKVVNMLDVSMKNDDSYNLIFLKAVVLDGLEK